ncbi:MAG: hypothetical protein ACO1OO_17055 [Flavisolibacter sp.]
MKRDFFDENFEWFLRRQADSFRMQASDKVWTQVSRELHKRRRRINMSLAALFLLVSGFGYFFISHSVKPLPDVAQNKTNQPAKATLPSANNKASTDASRSVVAAITNGNPAEKVAQSTPLALAANVFSEQSSTRLESGAAAQAQNAFDIQALPADGGTVVFNPAELNAPGTMENAVAENSIAEKPTTEENDVKPTVAEALADQVDMNANYVVQNTPSSNTIRKRKLDWQLSFTPTISYRKLGENKSYLRTAASLSANNPLTPLYSVNSMVTHKPDLGLELGVATKYQLTKNIKLIGGFQFNINRYDIKAFNGPYAVGTIQLNNGSSVSSVNTITGLSNTTGYHTNWLKNFYFQASAPIGVELKLLGTENMHFGIATSVQPSYLVGDRAYLITSDYKSYVQVPWLIRRWNANTNLQTFVSYSTGKMRWQVGPQVRYQLLSSFISEYPVKENLFDFGLKVGVSLNKQ